MCYLFMTTYLLIICFSTKIVCCGSETVDSYIFLTNKLSEFTVLRVSICLLNVGVVVTVPIVTIFINKYLIMKIFGYNYKVRLV